MDQYKELKESILRAANTNTVGIVVAVDRIRNTCDVQPVSDTLFRDDTSIPKPVIKDVPIVNYGTTNSLVLAPLSVDDIVVLHFIKDSIQEYLDTPDYRNYTPEDRRFMDYSDVVAVPANIKRIGNPSDVRNHSLTYADKSLIIKHNIGTNSESQVEMKDDGSIALTSSRNTTSVTLSSDGTITFKADSKIILDSEVEIKKGLEVQNDVVGNVSKTVGTTLLPVSLVKHTHGYIDTIGSTATPTPSTTAAPETPAPIP